MFDRREFLQRAGFGAAVASGAALVSPLRALAEDAVTLPFGNGERPLVAYPQKRPLIALTARPPQLETPFAVFNEGVITPNDAFFVRYHLADIPTADRSRQPSGWRSRARSTTPLSLSLAELKADAGGRDRRGQPVLGQQPRLLRAARRRRPARQRRDGQCALDAACR